MLSIDMARYHVEILNMDRIFCDASFNCRGLIARSECVDLAADVKERGLDIPIQVQPYDKNPAYDFRIISGHRRFTACQINKATTIPAIVRRDLVDEMAAREANLRENIQRADLNMVQESDAIAFFIQQGYAVNHIANKLGKSPGWVEVRRKLIDLPDMVRVAAREGVVTQNHIHQLYTHRGNIEKLSEMIRTIKERSERGERAIVIREDVQIKDFAAIRRPRPHEVEDFMLVIARNITNKLEDGQECFAHRVASWTQGYISLAQAYGSLRKECARLSLPFTPPADVSRLLDSLVRA